jgi:hypothetical protein
MSGKIIGMGGVSTDICELNYVPLWPLKNLMNDLLDLSKLEWGLITLQKDFLELNQIISNCIDDFR